MAIRLLSSENVNGNIDISHSQNAITYLAVTNTNTGVAANARAQVVGESAQLDIIATSAGYTGVTGWADSGIISTDSGASGGLKLNSQSGGIQFQIGTSSTMYIMSAGSVGINDDCAATALAVKDTQDSNFTSGISVIRSANSDTGYINMVGGAFNFNSTKNTKIRVSNTTRLEVRSAGINVIGETESDTLLVSGTSELTGHVGIGVAPHGTASLNITNANQHIRLNNGSELGIFELDTNGVFTMWAHGDGETINFQTGSGSGVVAMSVVGTKVGIGTTSPAGLLTIKGTGDAIRVESTNTGAGGAQIDLLHFTTSPADEDTHAMINMGGYYSGTTSVYGSQILSKWTDVSERHSRLEFKTLDTTLSTVLTLAHDKSATFAGDVGIGTNVTAGGFNVNNPASGSYYNMSNTDSGNFNYTNSGTNGRTLTTNGTGWITDGRDPILTLSSDGNSNSTAIGYSLGLNLYNNSSTNSTYSPLITFSALSESASYNSVYAAIGGKKNR